ncbi:MAG: type II toxin-antitoxin system HicA family toxin [Phycisphaerales bacterium]|nr:type II toxin-antitoxin system HicA family toxin [Phycisphaerales bacterium]
MPLPKGLRPRQVVRALQRAGWTVARQAGGHLILSKPGRRPIPVPQHKTIKTGLLRRIIVEAGLTVDEFNDLR